MTILLGGPPSVIPTPPANVLRTPLRHTWHGWDGSVWDLTGRRPTGVFLRPGVRGMNAPSVQPYLSELAGVNGSQPRGHRLRSREVFWPLSVWTDGSSQSWIDYDAAFWRTLMPGKVGTWEVQQPNGTIRGLRCTFDEDGGHAAEWDGGRLGWMQYGVRLRADQPLWQGAPVTRTWEQAETQNFFGGNGGGGFGPPFYISSAFRLDTATMNNPGDVDAWPTWTITALAGGVSSVSVGVAGRVVEVPFTMAEGEVLTIDTSPTEQVALLGGVERTGDLGAADFAPIPAGASRPLELALTGSGKVSAAITPLYLRAH